MANRSGRSNCKLSEPPPNASPKPSNGWDDHRELEPENLPIILGTNLCVTVLLVVAMSFSAKKFLQKYGSAGVLAYGGVTVVSVSSFYLGLRSGVDVLLPIEQCLGKDSELLQNLKAKLEQDPSSSSQGPNQGPPGSPPTNNKNINWVREGTYFGIAGALDSLIVPLKMMVSLPIARQIIKLRGRRAP